MRINYDCARCVMLYLEENLSYRGGIHSENLINVPILTSFNPDDIRYAVKQLYKEKMLACKVNHKLKNGDEFFIFDIEPEGHKFCDLIRNEENWKQEKPKFFELSTFKSIIEVLTATATIAGAFVSAMPK